MQTKAFAPAKGDVGDVAFCLITLNICLVCSFILTKKLHDIPVKQRTHCVHNSTLYGMMSHRCQANNTVILYLHKILTSRHVSFIPLKSSVVNVRKYCHVRDLKITKLWP